MKTLVFCTFGLKMPIQCRKNRGFRGFSPLSGHNYQRHSQKVHPSGDILDTTYRTLRSVYPFFCTDHSFMQPPKSCALQCFLIGQTPQKCPFPQGHLDPSNTWFTLSTQLSIPNCMSVGSAVFAQFTVESPYTLEWTATFPSKLSLDVGDLDSDLMRDSLDPSRMAS